MATARKPMTFDMDDPKLVTPTKIESKPTKKTSASASDAPQARKAVGARVPVSLYRQAKAHAALAGIPVQELLEIALRDYLANPEH